MSLEQKNWRPDLDIDRGSVIRVIDKTEKFNENPAPLTKEELIKLEDDIIKNAKPMIGESNLTNLSSKLDSNDIETVRKLLDIIEKSSLKAIIDKSRRPWNPFCRLHLEQTVCVVDTIVDKLIAAGEKIDKNKIIIKTLLHDVGRYATHEKELHGLKGRELLKKLGIRTDLRSIALAHLVSGFGLNGIKNEKKLFQVVEDLGEEMLENIVVVLSDNYKTSNIYLVDNKDKRFNHEIAKPDWQEDIGDSNLLLQKIENILMKKYKIDFIGPNGVIELAREKWRKSVFAKEYETK